MSEIWSKEEEVQRLQKRFDDLKALHKVSQARFARENQMPGGASMVTQHLKATRPISMEHALVYARGFKVELGEISPRLAKLVADGQATLKGGASAGDHGPDPIDLDNNPQYPAIRKVRFKLSAGASGFAVEYDGEDHAPIVFGKYWYEVNKFRPEALFAVRVANGSMEPGLYNGDIVVVNTLSTEPKDGVVFAVNYEGEMVIKRLIRDEGEWWLHSDNPDQVRYKRKRMHEDCFLIGEVVQKQSMRI